MEKQLESSIIARVNESYAEFCACSNRSKDLQIKAANLAREAGLLLIEYKRACPHGDFTKAFASFHGKVITGNNFAMSYEHASLLMRIATRYREAFTDSNFPERVRGLYDLLYAADETQKRTPVAQHLLDGRGPAGVPSLQGLKGQWDILKKQIDRTLPEYSVEDAREALEMTAPVAAFHAEIADRFSLAPATVVMAGSGGGNGSRGMATFEGLRMQWDILRRQIEPMLGEWTKEDAAGALAVLGPIELFAEELRERFFADKYEGRIKKDEVKSAEVGA